MMMTTTHNNTDINTEQRKRAPEEEEKLRDRWENRVVGALFRKLAAEEARARERGGGWC